jgi:integrase/recombinase XerD
MEHQIARFLGQLESDRGFSLNTISAYRNDLTQFSAYVCNGRGLRSWQELSESHLTSFVLHLRERQYARSTVARKVAAVKSFCGFLVSDGVLRGDPTENLASPKVDKFTPRAISREQIDLLLSHPGRERTPESIRDAAMLCTLYSTGMRVSELTALDLDDVDLANRVVNCGKRPDRVRQAPLAANAVEALETYLEVGRPLLKSSVDTNALFLNHRGSRLTRQGFWLILKSHAEAAGIGDITPHTIRHSFAVHQLANGRELRDIQRIMGHMSIATTQAYQQLVTLDGHIPHLDRGLETENELVETAGPAVVHRVPSD